jgi:hypothetical protein
VAAESKSLISHVGSDGLPPSAQPHNWARSLAVDLAGSFEIGLVFTLIMMAVWTPPGRVNAGVTLAAALSTLWLTARSRYSAFALGLARPGSGALPMLVLGAVLVIVVFVLGSALNNLGPAHPVPWNRAWQYAIWAMLQEFILQSFFYVRLKSLLGGQRAVWAAALLFAITHIPSPLLTLLSFGGGLVFCELFRRYRNIFPLGLVHATLGLAIAARLPDSMLHHMRVGLGYLMYRP